MEEFLTKLYSYENFSTYLIISIIILIILFIIILFFGKSDQKKREIEATKKLMKINEEAINDQFTMEENKKTEQEVLENDTIIVPNISDINIDNNVVSNNNDENIPEPVLPDIPVEQVKDNLLVDETPIANINSDNAFKEETKEEVVEISKQEEYPEFKNISEINEPVLSSNEEKPFEFDDFNFNGNIINPVEPEIKNEEFSKQEEVKVPKFDFDKIIRNVEEVAKEERKRGPEIFSSVYVPEKDIKAEENVVRENNLENDDEEFDLPTLKKEVEENNSFADIPKLNDYNLDEISGETYNIRQ